MLAKFNLAPAGVKPLATDHALIVLPAGKTLPGDLPGGDTLRKVMARRELKAADLAKSAVSADLGNGTLCAWVAWDATKTRFERLSSLRKALQPLLDDGVRSLEVHVVGDAAAMSEAAADTLYVVWANGAPLPVAKRKAERKTLERILWHGVAPDAAARSALAAVAEGNHLARELTAAAPNSLTPTTYRQRIAKLATEAGFTHQEYDCKKLRKLGAGAFLAVARGSGDDDGAAIVHLGYAPRGAKERIALVGKGICFDTGGHNLKPARHMAGMHEDMAGSAVVLGILHAARALKLPLRIDAWLAIARNHLSPEAYTQGEVVKALDGTTIEIVHTDAEGRMVLADTLCLAGREKPAAVIDFATLTGSMIVALGNRQSGVLSPDADFAAQAVAAGAACGERLVAFPVPADYAADLDSTVADVKQCTLDGEADHILAASFLQRFAGERPWLHVDLAAANCKGGLGAIATDVTGFGVAWGVEFLRQRSIMPGKKMTKE